ncbi:MAG: hypothetical protein WCC64_07275 [Aliidongia sp.]
MDTMKRHSAANSMGAISSLRTHAPFHNTLVTIGHGSPIASGETRALRTPPSSVASEGSLGYTTATMFDFQAGLAKTVIALEMKIDHLSERFSALEGAIGSMLHSSSVALLREDVSDEHLKQEIKQHFVDHDGETLYPSDISDALNVDYDRVEKLIGEMAEDGKIKRV